jgi:hypothetical protein
VLVVNRIVLVLAVSGCVPELADETATVSSPRLLAMRVEPAEARPGSAIATQSLWAGPDGVIAGAPLAWSFCMARKSLAEPGTVSAACLVADGPELIPIGSGESATGTLPAEACRLFGPDRPDPVPGETASRPTDPDASGGYYQPIQVLAGSEVSLASARIRCGLPEATPEQSMLYLRDYVANENPAVAAVTRAGQGDLVPLERDATAVVSVAGGETVDLDVAWGACDAAPCTGAEPYLWFDPKARALVSRREAIRVSWFATAGSFETSHSGRAEDDLETHAANRWSAPASGTAYLWVVVRDDRGGASWATFRLEVR